MNTINNPGKTINTIASKLVLLQAYQESHGIYAHSLENTSLTYISAFHSVTDITVNSLRAYYTERYKDMKIKHYYGISIREFFNTPVKEINLMFENATRWLEKDSQSNDPATDLEDLTNLFNKS